MTTTTFTLPVRRFAWKEYRTLRGLWLAVAALAIIVQAISAVCAMSGTDVAAWLFGTALAASALYAVGAAAILFAVEHEDETYSFLTGLPIIWLPVFAGKLLVAATSAVALAATLSLAALTIAGGHFPAPYVEGQIISLFGVAILEALVWGTFFSLLLRQPLLAALLTIFIACATVTCLITYFVGSTNSTLYSSSYVTVLPGRFAVLVIIALVDLWLARHWLPIANTSASPLPPNTLTSATAFFNELVRSTSISPAGEMESATYSSLNVIARLWWQSWRQSWKLMVLMLAILAFGIGVSLIILGIVDANRSYRSWLALFPFGVCVISTALFTSTAFYADQRRQQYRFLAQCAARPRYVWLCRLLTYAVPIGIGVALAIPLLTIYSSVWIRHFAGQTLWYFDEGRWYGLSQFSRDLTEATAAASGIALALWGIAIGFAVGQLCSLTINRALLASFAAVLSATILLGWGAVVWAWELPRIIFLLPLGIAPFVATWLRSPDWVIDRNHPRSWAGVTAVIVAPLLLIALFLPAARSVTADPTLTKRLIESSVPFYNPQVRDDTDPVVAATVARWIAGADANPDAEARANGDWLLRLSDLVTDLPQSPAETSDAEPSEEEIANRRHLRLEPNRDLIEQAVQLTQKDCHFPQWQFISRGSQSRDFAYEHVTHLIELINLAGVDETGQSNLDRALGYHLAALRLLNSVQSGQPTQRFWLTWLTERLHSSLVQWAGTKGQTPQGIRDAIRRLGEIYADDAYATTASPSLTGAGRPHPALIADYLLLRDVLLGRRSPTSFDSNPPYLAYLANQIPFERERALRVLDYLLVDQTDRWLKVRRGLNQQSLQRQLSKTDDDISEKSPQEVAARLRRQIELSYNSSYFSNDPFPINQQEPPYSWLRTTYLLRAEVGELEPFYLFLQRAADAEVAKWGLKQQLALIAYRLDHGAYPDSLDALAPDYLPFLPIDPYSGRRFEYRPEGFDREFSQTGYGPDIEPHTPVLWSVGAQDAQPQIESVDDKNSKPDADPSQPVGRHDAYRLYNPNGVPSIGSQLVFPLPK